MAKSAGRNDIVIGVAVAPGTPDPQKYIEGLNEQVVALGKNSAKKTTSFGRAGIFDDVSQGASLTRYQLLTLRYTVDDVIASLASGINPLTILFQQGGQLTEAFGGVGRTLSALLPLALRLAPAITAIGVAIAGFSFYEMGKGAAQAAEELGKLADRSKLTVDAFQDFAAAGAARGIKPEELASGISRLGDAALEASVKEAKFWKEVGQARNQYTGEIRDLKLAAEVRERYNTTLQASGDVFRDLRLSVAGFKNTPEELQALVNRVANAIQSLPANSQKAAQISKALEGIVGFNVLNLLKQGEAGIKELARRVNEIAPKLSEEQEKAARKYQESSRIYDEANKRLKESVGIIFLPAAAAGQDFFTQLLKNNAARIDSFRGGLARASEAIGAFFKALSGDREVGRRNPTIQLLADGLSFVVGVARTAATYISQAFSLIGEAASGVAKKINETFGTNWNAKTLLVILALNKIINPIGLVGKALLALGETAKGVFLGFQTGSAIAAIGRIGSAVFKLVGSLGILPLAFGAFALVIYSYKDKLGNVFENIGKTIVGSVVGNLEIAADTALKWFYITTGHFQAALKLDKQIEETAKTNKELLDSRPDLSEKGRYAGLTFQQEFLARLKDAGNDIAGFADKWFAPIIEKGRIAAKGVGDELKKVNDTAKDASKSDIRIIKAGRVEEVRIARDGVKQLAKEVESLDGKSVNITVGKGGITDGIQVLKSLETRAEEANKKKIEPDTTGLKRAKSDAEGAEKAVRGVGDAAEESGRKVSGASAIIANRLGAARNALPNAAQNAAPTAATPEQTGPDFTKALNDVGRIVTALQDAITKAQQLASGAVAAVSTVISEVSGTATSAIEGLIGAVSRAITKVNELVQATNSIKNPFAGGGDASGGSGNSGFASGGLITGPGTATSDSIPLWGSNGEFMVQAAAVRRLGLGFMRMINNAHISAPRFLTSAPRFASGGLIGGGVAAATESYKSSENTLALVIDTGNGKARGSISGPDNVVNTLMRYSVSRQITSTTKRRPSWA